MDALENYLGRIQMSDRSSADGMVFVQLIDCLVPLLILELKRAFSEGGRDPIRQAEYSALKKWGSSEVSFGMLSLARFLIALFSSKLCGRKALARP